MEIYPYLFRPIYKTKIWGGRALERLYARNLPAGQQIGESWELADLAEGVSVVSNGPAAGATLTELTRKLGNRLLGRTKAVGGTGGRFPLLLKLLDANDILSLQVHPDARAARRIGGGAAIKTECWYTVESRNGCIFKGVREGVTREQFAQALKADKTESLVQKIDVSAGDFHYLPAGTVHALGAGIVVAEVQTPSDTTYRVTDWGRGREIHVEKAMQCIKFAPAAPGKRLQAGRLLTTRYFNVDLRRTRADATTENTLRGGKCRAIMVLSAGESLAVLHDGVEPEVNLRSGDTVLLPAALKSPRVRATGPCSWLEITLPVPSGA